MRSWSNKQGFCLYSKIVEHSSKCKFFVFKLILKIFQVLKGHPSAFMSGQPSLIWMGWTTFFNSDDLLMLDYIFILRQPTNDTMDELEQVQSSWFPMCFGRQFKEKLYLSLPHQLVFG